MVPKMTKRARKKQRVYRKSQQKGCENATKLQEGESSRMGDNPHKCKELSGNTKQSKKTGLPQVMARSQALVPGRVTGRNETNKIQKITIYNTNPKSAPQGFTAIQSTRSTKEQGPPKAATLTKSQEPKARVR